jgi:hypothetical protein
MADYALASKRDSRMAHRSYGKVVVVDMQLAAECVRLRKSCHTGIVHGTAPSRAVTKILLGCLCPRDCALRLMVGGRIRHPEHLHTMLDVIHGLHFLVA